MKIAVAATGADLNAQVAHRLGTADFMLVIDTVDLSVKSSACPVGDGPGAGIQALSMVLGMGVRAVLAGYVSPGVSQALNHNGIAVVAGVQGSVKAVVEGYLQDGLSRSQSGRTPGASVWQPDAVPRYRRALYGASRQLAGMLPVLIGVVLLVGLCREFLSRDLVMAVFRGNAVADAWIGNGMGAIMAGNPVNSYVIGHALVDLDVGWAGATGLMLSWVSVGLIQLPAEITALGARFALLRNTAAFVLNVPLAMTIVFLAGKCIRWVP